MTGSSIQALLIVVQPNPSVRRIELAAAAMLTLLAMMLRWVPVRARRTNGLQQAALASAKWASKASRPTLRQVLGAAFAACAVGLFIGGAGGAIAGAMTGAGLLVFSSRRVSESEARARQRLIAAAPPPVDLFAAALAAGLLPADAASVVATAFNGETGPPEDDPEAAPLPVEPVREIAARFAAAAQALREGCEPEAAWRLLSIDAATAPVAAAALRASRTGAPASQTVAKAARDVGNAAEQAAQAQIRAVAVRATAPLALCFLPAFVLVGVVPTALGLLTELHA
ncbi:type II secretion system F family protein [Actinocrinis sp.]|uniref:type II secretion system F family protein n=1 Tax=Actinocrinis sp. TaxID=1920516 RepID=UPI002D39AAA7|nr:type II secretion system F family protein [Actinocrinis sp.]HZP52676.1 type II secretion system F family protein [Actinocrinis sp.]